MLDIFVAILQELFGGDQKKAAPRRRTRSPADAGRSGQTVATDRQATRMQTRQVEAEPAQQPDRQQTLNDLFRQLFEGERAEEAEAVEAPPPPPPPPPRRDPQARAKAPARLEAAAGIQTIEQRIEALNAAQPVPAAPAAATRPTASSPRAVPDYVAKLRGNADAARQAFVYSEIFGPPMADRQPR